MGSNLNTLLSSNYKLEGSPGGLRVLGCVDSLNTTVMLQAFRWQLWLGGIEWKGQSLTRKKEYL